MPLSDAFYCGIEVEDDGVDENRKQAKDFGRSRIRVDAFEPLCRVRKTARCALFALPLAAWNHYSTGLTIMALVSFTQY